MKKCGGLVSEEVGAGMGLGREGDRSATSHLGRGRGGFSVEEPAGGFSGRGLGGTTTHPITDCLPIPSDLGGWSLRGSTSSLLGERRVGV